MTKKSNSVRYGLTAVGLFAAAGLLVSCGGGDKSTGSSQPSPVVPAPAPQQVTTAAQGGTVIGPNGTSLEIPGGALSTDTVITIRQLPAGSVVIPSGAEAVGDVFEVSPAETTFLVPTFISLPAPEQVPDGKVYGLVEFGPRPAGSTADQMPGRLAAASGRVQVECFSPQSVAGGAARVETVLGGPKQGVFLDPQQCPNGVRTPPPNGGIPSRSVNNCSAPNEYVEASAAEEAYLVNRHVACMRGRDDSPRTANLFNPASANSEGVATVSARTSMYGPSNSLTKTIAVQYRYALRDDFPTRPGVKVMAEFECSPACTGPAVAIQTSRTPSASGWSTPIVLTPRFDVVSGVVQNYSVRVRLFVAHEQVSDTDLSNRSNATEVASFLFPTLRCDNGLAASNGGCVFPQAAAVLTYLRSEVGEVVDHVREAQAGVGLPRAAPGGDFRLKQGTRAIPADQSVIDNALQRTQVLGLKGDDSRAGANRNHSCSYADALIKERPRHSSSCPATGEGCDCDEYPFNSTWNGSIHNRAGTSVKFINSSQNRSAGAQTGVFYGKERLIDFTPNPNIVYSRGNDAISIPPKGETENFWVTTR